MKKILLASASIVAFAGAAAAEVSFGGDANFGYNDDVEDGFYWDAGLTVSMSQDLDNGLSVAASLDVDLDDTTAAGSTTGGLGSVATSDWVITLSNEMASLSFGDVATAAASFAFVSDMDGWNDHSEDYAAAEAGILASVNYGSLSIAASSVVSADPTTGAGNSGDNGATQITASYDLGMATVSALYVDEETKAGIEQGDVTAFTVETTLGGVDLTATYGTYGTGAGTPDIDAFGLAASYAMGDVTLSGYMVDVDEAGAETIMNVNVAYASGPIAARAYYTENRGTVDGANEWSVAGSYDFGNGLVINAGLIDGDDAVAGRGADNDQYNYIVAEYDLGGGAAFMVSYADANDDAALNSDDIDTTLGGYELMSGVTAELSFAF